MVHLLTWCRATSDTYPQRKTTLHADDLTGRLSYKLTTSQEDYFTGRWPNRKTTSQEDYLTGRPPHRKTTSQKDNLSRKPTSKKDYLKDRWPHMKTNLQDVLELFWKTFRAGPKSCSLQLPQSLNWYFPLQWYVSLTFNPNFNFRRSLCVRPNSASFAGAFSWVSKVLSSLSSWSGS